MFPAGGKEVQVTGENEWSVRRQEGETGHTSHSLSCHHDKCLISTNYCPTLHLSISFSAEKNRYLLNILHIQATLFIYIDILFELEMKRS